MQVSEQWERVDALGCPAPWPYNRATLFVESVMPNLRLADLTAEIEANVRRALLEDIGLSLIHI